MSKRMSIRLILTLAVLSGSSLAAARVVLSLYALDLGAQPFAVGALAAMFSVFPLLLAVPVGRIADRLGARWPLIGGSCASALILVLPYFAPGLPALFAVAAVLGVADVIFSVSLQSLVGSLSSSRNRPRNFSYYSLSWAVSNFVGPLAAGFVLDLSGPTMTCIYLALFTLIPAVLLAAQNNTIRGDVRPVTPVSNDVWALIAAPGIYRVLAISSMLNTGHNIYQFYLPVYAHSIALSGSQIGMILAAYAAGELLIRLVLPQLIERFKERKVLFCAFFIGAASLMLTPFFHGLAPLALISFALGLGMGCGGPIVMTMMYANSPVGRSAEALGLRMSANHVIKVLAPLLFGSVAASFGLPVIFWINAFMLAGGGIISRARNLQ